MLELNVKQSGICGREFDVVYRKSRSGKVLKVGVHIADVTHFVRPGTALDDEAAFRGTTVNLCDRRIDMLPELLSSNLCSLRKNVDRFAFSVIWTLTASADIIDVRFHKSVIRSRGALFYEMAQNRMDNPDLNDDVTKCLRNLFMLSRHLRNKRQGNGALNLAYSELRFNIDEATKEPISVQAKEHLDTNSMVEEFMLLANISVAEKICADFPDCAVLRRHPVPIAESYKSLIEVHAPSYGFESIVVFPKDLNYLVSENSIQFGNITLSLLQKVRVSLSLDESDIQHIRIDVKLIMPKILGLSVDYLVPTTEGW